MIKAVLFDLDGTLLPMDEEIFIKDYFTSLIKKISPHGYDPDQLVSGIWKATKSMMTNNGEKLNEHVFWEDFSKTMGEEVLEHMPLFEDFYNNDFDLLSSSCGYNEKAKEVVDKVKNMGYRVVLATNPVFPKTATEKRLKWVGLSPQDFELCTTYENSSYCKPNIKYYEHILNEIGCKAEECLMVGNNATEDMIASTLGMKVFLLTDCLINKEDKDISNYPSGSYDELIKYIDSLYK
ncbi:MAG: HAD family hydrolase [Romboutsia sp.]|nr:HAD family hydrolase [Romboutsia sp.]